jgi:hypothetical protein
MMRLSEDWISKTMRTVDAVMKQHGFEEDVPRRIELPANEIIAQKRLSIKKLLRALASGSANSD